jgi:hypothetical protein
VKRPWLELFDWEFVTATNAALCRPKDVLHKPTSDGHDRTRQLWERNYRREMFLDEAADLCRECHRLAPFCNFNGNTFAAVARSLVESLKLKADEAHVIRSLLGHVVAGTASDLETEELREFSRSLTAGHLKRAFTTKERSNKV